MDFVFLLQACVHTAVECKLFSLSLTASRVLFFNRYLESKLADGHLPASNTLAVFLALGKIINFIIVINQRQNGRSPMDILSVTTKNDSKLFSVPNK